jgi:hypothetical protein
MTREGGQAEDKSTGTYNALTLAAGRGLFQIRRYRAQANQSINQKMSSGWNDSSQFNMEDF